MSDFGRFGIKMVVLSAWSGLDDTNLYKRFISRFLIFMKICEKLIRNILFCFIFARLFTLNVTSELSENGRPAGLWQFTRGFDNKNRNIISNPMT